MTIPHPDVQIITLEVKKEFKEKNLKQENKLSS